MTRDDLSTTADARRLTTGPERLYGTLAFAEAVTWTARSLPTRVARSVSKNRNEPVTAHSPGSAARSRQYRVGDVAGVLSRTGAVINRCPPGRRQRRIEHEARSYYDSLRHGISSMTSGSGEHSILGAAQDCQRQR